MIKFLEGRKRFKGFSDALNNDSRKNYIFASLALKYYETTF